MGKCGQHVATCSELCGARGNACALNTKHCKYKEFVARLLKPGLSRPRLEAVEEVLSTPMLLRILTSTHTFNKHDIFAGSVVLHGLLISTSIYKSAVSLHALWLYIST